MIPNPLFQTVDLSGVRIPEHPKFKFTYADLPADRSIPFAMVHYASLGAIEAAPQTLRLDLGKRVFLDGLLDPPLRAAAVFLSDFLGRRKTEEIQPAAEVEPALRAATY